MRIIGVVDKRVMICEGCRYMPEICELLGRGKMSSGLELLIMFFFYVWVFW
jgi:hypothetical protein